ncbi:hypothetical protein HOS99_gp100 [Staphylococcus phage phiSA_BS1]|uniref:Uncharacterized protein n=2 Tax=Baoshanvirus TaxID=2732969 RepID=A0A2P1MXR3_9CAUD|nr:hypothetical protein HOS99_gp100 [Staphylococcus phage phiSA_BS1]YP_009800023.1 hypothetical protein HOT02_gp183 [Staphylococcus phage phiSA_BS2]AVP40345.1 hypothetical protein [Staphylococcus phage phiSA_BS1]AVR55627.1 hypothetical protein phiSABS2_183 [Staphylococcus phage phiSA_BS2]
MDKHIQSILGDLRLLHMYTTDEDTFIVTVLDVISEFQEYSDKEIVCTSDDEFAKFLRERVHKEILLGNRNEKS